MERVLRTVHGIRSGLIDRDEVVWEDDRITLLNSSWSSKRRSPKEARNQGDSGEELHSWKEWDWIFCCLKVQLLPFQSRNSLRSLGGGEGTLREGTEGRSL